MNTKQKAEAEAKQKAKKAAEAAAAKGGAVAAPAGTALVDGKIDFAADAGAGLEGADKDSFAIPFLAILQPNSPQVVDGVIVGARAGMFLNTVTLALFEKPRFIPCAFQRRWIRWGAREAGGGFKGEFTTSQANELREKKQVVELDGRLYFPDADGNINPKKNDRLSDTRSHFVVLCEGPESELGAPAVLALTSTNISTSKNLISRIDSRKVKTATGFVNAPSFSAVYEAKTEKKTNDKGTWFKAQIDVVGDVTNASLYAQAKAFHAQVTAGKVKVDHEKGLNPDDSGGAPQEGF